MEVEVEGLEVEVEVEGVEVDGVDEVDAGVSARVFGLHAHPL